jgi:ATPase family associated with various cellular activities (AAA)
MLKSQGSKKAATLKKLKLPVQGHLGIGLEQAHSVSHEIRPIQRVNIQRVLDCWAAEAEPPVQAFGYALSGFFTDDGLVRYLITDEVIQAPVEREHLECGPTDVLDCVVRGLFLFRWESNPVVVVFRPPRFQRDLPILDVIAASRDIAKKTLLALLDEAQRESVYKGRTLSVEFANTWPERVNVQFQQVRAAAREDIVLPDELIQVVERNVLGTLRHAATLRAAGRDLRRGLLFHGAPGTGKTMVIRYLTGAAPDHTILMLTGARQGLAREACQMARMLAPSIVVLEDVDLVAEKREDNRFPTVLHELLNEMDGLGPRDEVTFLLTTNRPEVLEPALAARPGRVDQAIAFPLPDENRRRRLFDVYGRGLDLAAVDVGRWVGQTSGVSPAFIQELLRKAALLAAERGEQSQPLRLSDADLHKGLHELVYFGGELTQKLLGYRTGRVGFQPTDAT